MRIALYLAATASTYFDDTPVSRNPWAPVAVPAVEYIDARAHDFDDPPNHRAPKILPARQSDRAPLSSIAQCGYWLNQVGRRAS